ncbi:guided entry of tail-anchored proteins factor 1-like [Zophobas morio]|uniref:guided entry of tail-anchored proteins factor 1-like n=1 Tax=Zophobas morio TaxID=2755281 RepID=UPI003082DA7E
MNTSEFSLNFQAFVISTVLSFLSVHSSVVEKPIFKWLNKQTERERSLLVQKHSLKTEQASINMVDEFAKYSKIQRQINSIDGKLEDIRGNKPTNNILVQLGFTYGVKFVLVVMLIVLSLYYRYTPVFYLGNKINLMPFTHFICYPNDINCVSFYFWVMCSAAVSRMLQML